MKQKDIILIVVIAFISAVLSILLSNQLIVSPKDRQTAVEVVTPIKSKFSQPDKRYFNKDSVDPTRLITIGQNANSDPFSGSQ